MYYARSHFCLRSVIYLSRSPFFRGTMDEDLSEFLAKAKLRKERAGGPSQNSHDIARKPTLTLGEFSWLVLRG